MYVLVLITCMTFSGKTHCQSFPRDVSFATLAACDRVAAIERGRYVRRIEERRQWLRYEWQCDPLVQ